MNYFEFYNLKIAFLLDEKLLKKQFYILSRKYHPDFYTLESEEKQAEILELSSLNTQAYKTLSDFDARMKYILTLKNVLGEEGTNKIPQGFLMEMMDINEALMELEFDCDEVALAKVEEQIDEQAASLQQSIQPILERYNDENPNEEDLNTIKSFYFKRKYIWRLKNNLEKFK